MKSTPLGVSQVRPDGSVIGQSNEGDARFERATCGCGLHAGMTASERIGYGHATAEDLAWYDEQLRERREFEATPEHQAWLAEQRRKEHL